MISFLINLVLLGQTLWRGVREDPEFRALATLLGIILIGGTLFYWRIEGWGVLDSLYFCVMTIATIGYGDFTPTSGLSKAFTICYAVLGIGLFASVVGKLVMLWSKRHTKNQRKHTAPHPE